MPTPVGVRSGAIFSAGAHAQLANEGFSALFVRMFNKGQRVVCINDDFQTLAYELFEQMPKKDSVYTVRACYIGRGNLTQAGSGKQDGEIGVLLEEVRNPRDPALKSGLNGELGFNSERFAPLEEKTDESTLTEEEDEEILIPA